MDPTDNPYTAPEGGMIRVTGADCLLVNGNVNVGKNKGQGQLLFTPASVFAFRTKNQAVMAGGLLGGLLGALIGRFIDKQLAKRRVPPEHMDDPEIQGLEEAVRKKIERVSLLAKLPLGNTFKIERTRLGFKLDDGGVTTVIYQGLIHKNKIADFLVKQGIDVR